MCGWRQSNCTEQNAAETGPISRQSRSPRPKRLVLAPQPPDADLQATVAAGSEAVADGTGVHVPDAVGDTSAGIDKGELIDGAVAQRFGAGGVRKRNDARILIGSRQRSSGAASLSGRNPSRIPRRLFPVKPVHRRGKHEA